MEGIEGRAGATARGRGGTVHSRARRRPLQTAAHRPLRGPQMGTGSLKRGLASGGGALARPSCWWRRVPAARRPLLSSTRAAHPPRSPACPAWTPQACLEPHEGAVATLPALCRQQQQGACHWVRPRKDAALAAARASICGSAGPLRSAMHWEENGSGIKGHENGRAGNAAITQAQGRHAAGAGCRSRQQPPGGGMPRASYACRDH